jgi:hypothetical protein
LSSPLATGLFTGCTNTSHRNTSSPLDFGTVLSLKRKLSLIAKLEM